MTAICRCDLAKIHHRLPLEHNRKFYCGWCGGMFEGEGAVLARKWWAQTGRINAMVATGVREVQWNAPPKKRKPRRSPRAKKGRGRE